MLILALSFSVVAGVQTVKAAPVNSSFSIAIEPGSTTTTVNQTVQFTATVSGGTPPYSYQWYSQLWPDGDIVAVAGANSSSFAFTQTSPGMYGISVRVRDSLNMETYFVGLPGGIWVTVLAEQTPSPIISILSPANTSYSAIYDPFITIPLIFETNASLS
jgi:hypothetical protein